jgi:hypothetical protein
LLTLLLWQPAPASAQWVTAGGDINNTNVGAVGVGTATPGAKLDIGAGAPARGAYTDLLLGRGGNNPQLEFFGSSKSAAIQFDEAAGGLVFYVNSPVWAQAFFVGNTGGVGVGTVNPLSRLHVEGGSALGSIRVSGSGMAVMNFKDTTAPSNQKLYQWRSEGGSFRMTLLNDDEASYAKQNILVVNPSGNVGVGTAAPSTALEVGGGGTLSLSGGAASGQGNIRFGASPSTLFDTNLIYLNSNAGTTGITASGTPAYSASNGPFVALRGNSFTTLPNQRGNVTFSAGSVAGPSAGEGGIVFRTGAEQVRLFITHTGVVGVGGAPAADSPYKLDVVGSARVSADLSVTGTVTGGTIQATYQDVAEWVPSVEKLSAGTVVVLDAGRNNHVVASGNAYDTKVAGVVSAEPGVILGVPGDDKVKVATTGRVRVRVDATRGAIKVGDLLVTSDVSGVAMKSVPVDLGGVAIHRPGTIIGKALEPLEKGVAEILVLLSLQ